MVENSSEPLTQAAAVDWPVFAASIASLRETGQWPCMALLVGRLSEGARVLDGCVVGATTWEGEGGMLGACAMETSAVSTEFSAISESRIRAGLEVVATVAVVGFSDGVGSSDGNEASEDVD